MEYYLFSVNNQKPRFEVYLDQVTALVDYTNNTRLGGLEIGK